MKAVLGAVLAISACARWDDTCAPTASWTVPVRWADGHGLVNVQGQYAWSARGDGTSVIAIGPPLYGEPASDVVIAGMTVATPALATIGPDGTLLAAFSAAATVSGAAPAAVVIDPAGAITAQWTALTPCRVVHYVNGAPAWEVSQYPACGPIAASPDGAVAYVVADTTSMLSVVEADGTARWTITLPDDALAVRFGDASHLVVQTVHAVLTIDAATGTVLATLPGYWFATNGDGVLVTRFETEASATPVESMFGFDGAERWTRRDPLPNASSGLAPTGRVVFAGAIPEGVAASFHLRAGFDGIVVLDGATGATLTARETCPTFQFQALTPTGVLSLTGGPDITAFEVPGL